MAYYRTKQGSAFQLTHMSTLEKMHSERHISESSESLQEIPAGIAEIIDVAMSKVRKGYPDAGNGQTVFLRGDHRLYLIRDEQVQVEWVGPFVKSIHSEGPLGAGLAMVVIADTQGGYLFAVHLPRSSKEHVTPEVLARMEHTIYLGGAIHLTAEQLKDAKKTSLRDWERVLNLPWNSGYKKMLSR